MIKNFFLGIWNKCKLIGSTIKNFFINLKYVDWATKFKTAWNAKYGLKYLTVINPWMLLHEFGHWIVGVIAGCPIKFIKDWHEYWGYQVLSLDWKFVNNDAPAKNKKYVKSAGFFFEIVFGSLLFAIWFNAVITWLYVLTCGIHFALYFHTADPIHNDFTPVE